MNNKIGRFLLKNYLSFEKVDIDFNTKENEGLNLFTGASGAGKSILLKSLISAFGGTKNIDFDSAEIEILNNSLKLEEFELEGNNEDFTIKCIKKDKISFFLNDYKISKNKLSETVFSFLKHLHLKDTSEFDSKNFLQTLDKISLKDNKEYSELLNDYIKNFKERTSILNQINEINNNEKNLEDTKEFLKFEIDKIKKINPKVDEFDELLETKKRLSQKDKITEKIAKARNFLNGSSQITSLLNEVNEDSTLFLESIQNVENIIDKLEESLEELNDIDIEGILDRISDINSLNNKYGSIEKCLEEFNIKQKKLDELENITFTKKDLLKKLEEINKILEENSKKITEIRKKTSILLNEKINYYLKFLYLDNAEIIFKEVEFNSLGKDEIYFKLNNVNLETISSGEFNRLRLALLTARTDFEIESGGILFLDEIDANLSGKESESIAKVVTKLSKNYQIFAISHQPQLTSQADKHYLVEKKDGKSSVRLLTLEEREKEISRMISGENITEEAKIFAKNLLKSKNI